MKYFLLFSNYFPCETFGGMETHCTALAEWIKKETMFDLVLVSMSAKKMRTIKGEHDFVSKDSLISTLCFLELDNSSIFFFNDGYWIEWIENIRKSFPRNIFFFRSGGNDLMYAPTHEMNIPIFERRKIWVDTFNNNINHVIVNSSFSQRNFELLGVNKSILVKLRGGVDYKFCEELMANRKEIRDSFIKMHNIPKGTTILCICSRFVPFKGIDKALSAISILNDLQLHLILVGDGQEKENILQFCDNHLISYTYVGAQLPKKALEYECLSDVLLNTSILYCKKSGSNNYIHTETMGRSMIEAITLGIPIVATDVGGTRELFIENKGKEIGVLCSDDVNSIASAIEAARKIPVKNNVGSKYDWGYIFRRYMELYEQDLCM